MITLFFHPNGKLDSEKPSTEEASKTYVYDPNNPVPTIGGNLSSLAGSRTPIPGTRGEPLEEREMDKLVPMGGFDQVEHEGFLGSKHFGKPLSEREDVIVFQTEPLEHPTLVTGRIIATLYISTNAKDTDFTLKIVDVYPTGRAFNISDSIVRGRYHKSLEKAELLEPGKIYKMEFEVYPTSNLFSKGHRIRVDISSSNWPRFDANPNTGDHMWANKTKLTAHNTLYFSKSYPSNVRFSTV